MRKRWWFAIAPVGCFSIVALFFGVLVLALFLIKVLWAWTIPDLFPGAVEQGLVAESLSWFTAFKLAIFVALLGALAGTRRSGKSGFAPKVGVKSEVLGLNQKGHPQSLIITRPTSTVYVFALSR